MSKPVLILAWAIRVVGWVLFAAMICATIFALCLAAYSAWEQTKLQGGNGWTVIRDVGEALAACVGIFALTGVFVWANEYIKDRRS